MTEKLTEAESHSKLWLKLKKIMEERLNKHRVTNDKNLDEVVTAKLRGQIAELKFLLDLEIPDPAPTKDAD